MARKICSFANASNKPTRENAIFQRGQFYVVDSTGKADPYRYQIFINDSLLGLCRRKDLSQRFCQAMYVLYPFAEDVDKGSKTRSGEWMPLAFGGLTKKYRIKERPTMDVEQTTTKTKSTRNRRKSVARTTPGDQKPRATKANLNQILEKVIACELPKDKALQLLSEFQQLKAVTRTIQQVQNVNCRPQRQPTPEQRKLSRKDLAELDTQIPTLDAANLRALILDLNLNVKRTAAVEKRIKAAQKRLKGL